MCACVSACVSACVCISRCELIENTPVLLRELKVKQDEN